MGAPIPLAQTSPRQPLGELAGVLTETAAPLSIDDVVKLDMQGRFSQGEQPILTFGIGSKPVWVRLSVDNIEDTPLARRLVVENAWLDHVAVYFVHDRKVVQTAITGDAQVFRDRPVPGRFFAFDHVFAPGVTSVYLRVETDDPVVVPIFLMERASADARAQGQDYSYGFLYGYLMALLAYNLFLYFGLNYKRHLYYGAFIGMFILLNVAYTGHGFAWLWPDYPDLQKWIIPILMVGCGLAGLNFGRHFLETRVHLPRLHRAITATCLGVLLLLLLSFAAGTQYYALLLAFAFMLLFSALMLLMGVAALQYGHRYARYFLLASIASMSGVGATSLAVWGWIPFNNWTYRAAEIGLVIDATLLALALAYQFRTMQMEHRMAEQLAARDPLTGLNNRRAFYALARPVWSLALRKQHELSVILLDIDHFKAINDQYGHACGDAALVAVSNVLAGHARAEDIVSRWGGEEFLVLLPETGLEAALIKAQRLLQEIRDIRLPWRGECIAMTASFGVVAKAAYHQTLNEIIADTDQYLYKAKTSGRDSISSPE